MTKAAQEIPIGPWVLDDPHEQEPAQAAEQRAEDVDGDAELGLVDAVVGARERAGGPVAQRAHEDGEDAAREGARPEVAVLRDVQVIRGNGPDLRKNVSRDHEEGDEHGGDHQDPEDGRVDEVDEDLRQEVRDGLCRIACSIPGREGLRVGPPWDLLGWARRVDRLGLVVPALLLLGPVGARLGLRRRVCGLRCCWDELGFW